MAEAKRDKHTPEYSRMIFFSRQIGGSQEDPKIEKLIKR